MGFAPQVSAIRPIVERRLLHVPDTLKAGFPTILRAPVNWLSFGDDRLLALVFLTTDDIRRVQIFTREKLDPFPGLLTTERTLPAAFRFDRSRFGLVEGCSVRNSISFSVGVDTTFAVVNHSISIDTQEKGQVSYSIPLGYFGLFRTICGWTEAYQRSWFWKNLMPVFVQRLIFALPSGVGMRWPHLRHLSSSTR